MIITKEIKINIIENLTNDYIESELAKLNLDILSWAITKKDTNYYLLNISYITNE